MSFVIQLVVLVMAFGSVLVLATDGNAVPGLGQVNLEMQSIRAPRAPK